MKTKLAAVLAIASAIGICLWFFPSLQAVMDAILWMQHAGPVGGLVFSVLYGVASVAMVPASWTHGTAGFLYGPIAGPPVGLALATGWACVNFWLGRTLLRSWVERTLTSRPRFKAVDALVEQRGLMVVLLLRVSPISPFNPLSYALGASKLRFRDFFIGTLVGGILPVLLWSSVGASVSDLPALFAGESAGPGWLQSVGLIATIIASVVATWFAKQALDAAMRAEPQAP